MQIIDGNVVYSATDLVGYLACGHLTNLERAASAGLVRKPIRVDPELDRIVMRGEQHEARFLADVEATGARVVRIALDASVTDRGEQLRDAAHQTIAAMQAGADVIYQATFFDGRRRGHPDFLVKVTRTSQLGDWSYEVWDTKLARHPTGSAVLQVCMYSDQLAAVQGLKPQGMYLALGGSQREQVSLRVDDYAAYYRFVKAQFESLLAGGDAAYPPLTRPDPVEHCEVCRWSEVCRNRRREEDDLSLVAGITSNQRRHLRERGVATRTDLSSLVLPMVPPLRGSSASSIVRVREQARIQVEGERAGEIISELIDPPRNRADELLPGLGLASLPEPSIGDLFFDIEGDPFALEDGVDYLFGVIEPRIEGAEGEPAFHRFWSLDARNEVTFEAERKAFEDFIDLVMERLAADPNLHIYHYAPYEPTAVRRLMGRYGTREDDVDRLLRGGIFVDLFRVARQGIRASVESYSIKRLEPLYGFERTVDLRDAGSSIVAFETWLELGGDARGDGEILQRIEDYNKDDCVSTWKLRDWLEGQRLQLAAQMGIELPRPVPEDQRPNEDLQNELDRTLALAASLIAGISGDPGQRSAAEQGRWLLAQLLSWHRREEKPMWWRYFYLKNELTDEERIGEPDALSGLIAQGRLRQEDKSYVYGFSYPPQDHKIAIWSAPRDQDGQAVGTVVGIDDERGTVEIKRGVNADPPSPTSLIPLDYVPAATLKANLLSIGQWVADNGIDAAGRYQAARELLQRMYPNVSQAAGRTLLQEGEAPANAARRLITQLDSSYLAVQGPPGAGKTTVGAEMIVDLVAAGKRVGVTATSHKVIGQLLAKTAEVAVRRRETVRIGQRSGDETAIDGVRLLANNAAAREALTLGELDVVGATVWLWSREDMDRLVDVLFVDEAGQISLANVVAASSAADSLVLLGDPQQLDQPLQGVHPPGAGKSSLGHVLGEHQTMPPEFGLFLDGTWRLHPDVCAYTSEVFYDGLLHSQPGRELQQVRGVGELNGAGVRFIPVIHDGHSSESDEEAAVIAGLVTELLATNPRWFDSEGREVQLGRDDVLVVTPYNAQVRAIGEAYAGLRTGTVDKFQGQEAPISIYSMATSSVEDAPRGMEFLYSLNRLNVATSRAQCLAVLVANPSLLRVHCRTPRQMQLANALARFVEMAGGFENAQLGAD